MGCSNPASTSTLRSLRSCLAYRDISHINNRPDLCPVRSYLFTYGRITSHDSGSFIRDPPNSIIVLEYIWICLNIQEVSLNDLGNLERMFYGYMVGAWHSRTLLAGKNVGHDFFTCVGNLISSFTKLAKTRSSRSDGDTIQPLTSCVSTFQRTSHCCIFCKSV